MANLVPTPSWDDVYQIEQSDRVLGGPGGVSNRPLQELLNRTTYIRKNGGALPFDPDFAAEIGGFDVGARVKLDDGSVVISTVENNTANPNTNMTGWRKPSASEIFDESGESQQTVNLKGASLWVPKSGGYSTGDKVRLDTGPIVISKINGNTENPNDSLDNWIFNHEGYVTPQMFGAKEGEDNTQAFVDMLNYVVTQYYTPPWGGNPMLSVGIVLPPMKGGYRITQPRVLIPDIDIGRRMGLAFHGIGMPVINFDYDGDDYLMYNYNKFLFVSFFDVIFSCDSNLSKFSYSYANGGTQDTFYTRCNWEGNWQKIWTKRGVNNNSEMGCVKCAVASNLADVMLDLDDSDQFLNYWFDQCKLWLYDGQCVRANKGGHIKFVNCDWSGIQGSRSLCTSTKGKYLFELTGTTHARGVCDFRIINGRFELKRSYNRDGSENTVTPGINARLLYSEWNQGNIELSIDAGSTVLEAYDNEYLINMNPNAADAGAMLKVRDSQLVGKIRLASGVTGFNQRKVHRFDTCTFLGTNNTKPSDFFDIVYNDQTAGMASVELIGCRSGAPVFETPALKMTAWDLVLGNKNSVSSANKKNVAFFQGDVFGNNPVGNAKCYLQLPPNSIITHVYIENTGNGGDNTALGRWGVFDSDNTQIFAMTIGKTLRTMFAESIHTAYKTTSGLLYLHDVAQTNVPSTSQEFKCWVEYVC